MLPLLALVSTKQREEKKGGEGEGGEISADYSYC